MAKSAEVVQTEMRKDIEYIKNTVAEIKEATERDLVPLVQFRALEARVKLLEKAVWFVGGFIILAFLSWGLAQIGLRV